MTKHKTLVMGILNVTPDSFSDGGEHNQVDQAIARAFTMLEEGADIIDVGGESTRPGADFINAGEEWNRILPVLKRLLQEPGIRISVDTYKAEVAKRALDLGVPIINDVCGGAYDSQMLPLIAEAGCEYIWMHNRSEPPKGDGVATLFAETKQGIERCLQAGIEGQNLWIDPGIGFGKTYEQNLSVLHHLPEYATLGYRVLLGGSRKRFIGHALNLPLPHRLEGSLAVASWGVWSGVHAVRVHDVEESVRVCKLADAIQNA